MATGSPKLSIVSNPENIFDSRKHFISVFNKTFKAQLNRENPLPFGACMRAMQGRFKFEDEETGEILIEYPTEEAWKEQIEGMFQDEFCKKNRIYDFPFFLKQFGRFKPIEEKKQVKKTSLMIICDNPECGKQRQPFGCCEHCGK
jgi:hypothetical protein